MENKIPTLSIFGYIRRCVDRILKISPGGSVALFTEFEMEAAETYQTTKLRGAAQLIKDNTAQVRKFEDGFSWDTLGLARQIIPHLAKETKLRAPLPLLFRTDARTPRWRC